MNAILRAFRYLLVTGPSRSRFKRRSAASRKGWATRRAKANPPPTTEERFAKMMPFTAGHHKL
jgi:hypothetical protein